MQVFLCSRETKNHFSLEGGGGGGGGMFSYKISTTEAANVLYYLDNDLILGNY